MLTLPEAKLEWLVGLSIACGIASLASGLVACGGAPVGRSAHKHARGTGPTMSVVIRRDADQDDDNSSGSHYDADEYPYVYFGRPARASERRAIEDMLRRYYAVAAARDGGRACAFVYPPEREAIVELYNRSGSRSGPRLKTCAAVATRTFAQHHRELLAKRAKLTFVSLRTEGDLGVALLGFGGETESYLLLHREGSWKTLSLEDLPVP